MIHFETYHWEDHVPRKGGWKFNLAVGAIAFGLIAAAMPDTGRGTPFADRAPAMPGADAEWGSARGGQQTTSIEAAGGGEQCSPALRRSTVAIIAPARSAQALQPVASNHSG